MLGFFKILFVFATLISIFADADVKVVNFIGSMAVFLMWLINFSFFRIFNANLINLIVEILKDMKYFVGVLMIAILAIGNAFDILDPFYADEEAYPGNTIWRSLIFSYNISIGAFETDTFPQKNDWIIQTLWFLQSLINFVILLNMLIAAMGDTYDRV